MAIALLVLLVIMVPKVDSGKLKSDLNQLQDEVNALESKIELLDKQVYFKATFGAPTPTVGAGTVVFDKVQENIGNAYNPTSGVFTAPVKGLYVFLVQSFIKGAGDANWDLHVNGQMVLRGESTSLTTATSNEYMYPVTLQAGDKVSVYSRNEVNIWGTNHSFLAGWMVKALSDRKDAIKSLEV